MDSFLGGVGSRPTDKVTLCPTNPAFSKSTCPDDFKIHGRQYTRKSALAKGHRSRERRSPIWRFGEDIVCVNDGIDVYYCWICECEKKRQDLPVLKGNSSALNHMMSHGYDRDGNKTEKSTKTIPETRTFYALVTATKYESFKTLLVRWIVYCQVAFAMLENEYFRELLACLNQSIADLLPRARATLRGWIMDEYVDRKAAIKDELAEAISDIHLSFDLWTAPNYISILGVYGHWIGPSGQRMNKLLAFRRVFGKHAGENQAQIVLDVLDEFQIQERVGCLVGDNAASNDTAVSTILKALYPKLTKKQQTAFRIRCLGHIVNLCAHALIFGKGKGNRREALARAERKGDEDGWTSAWRQIGAVGRLHNIVRYIRWSPQRREEFANCIQGGNQAEFDQLELIQDNDTRWNSFYLAISRALEVKERLELFCKKHKPELKLGPLRDDLLTHTHWYHLSRIQDCLNLFHVATLEIEGNGAFFYDWFPQLSWLLDELDNWRADFADEASKDPTFAMLSDAARHAWLKCEKYYKLADDTPFSYAAVILNPTMKKQWFVDRWSSGTAEQRSWIPQVEEQVRQHWLCFYKHTGTANTLQPSNPARASLPASSDDLRERLRVYKRVKLDHEASSDGIDDFEEYLRTDLIPCDATFDPVEYWLSRRQAKPQLAKFALDCLAIPPMSDACERSFSSGRDLIHYKRSRLLGDVIEACTCLRNWYGKPATRKVKTKEMDKHGNTVVADREFDVFDDEERVKDAHGNA
jgi:hypothetical protein